MTKAVAAGMCLNRYSASACLEQRTLYNQVKSNCETCIEKCENLTIERQEACVDEFCQTQELDLEGSELYKKCQIQRTKETCGICLEEYFMPASYPLQMAEWISQEVVKYPLVAKSNNCIGGPVKILLQSTYPGMPYPSKYPDRRNEGTLPGF